MKKWTGVGFFHPAYGPGWVLSIGSCRALSVHGRVSDAGVLPLCPVRRHERATVVVTRAIHCRLSTALRARAFSFIRSERADLPVSADNRFESRKYAAVIVCASFSAQNTIGIFYVRAKGAQERLVQRHEQM